MLMAAHPAADGVRQAFGACAFRRACASFAALLDCAAKPIPRPRKIALPTARLVGTQMWAGFVLLVVSGGGCGCPGGGAPDRSSIPVRSSGAAAAAVLKMSVTGIRDSDGHVHVGRHGFVVAVCDDVMLARRDRHRIEQRRAPGLVLVVDRDERVRCSLDGELAHMLQARG